MVDYELRRFETEVLPWLDISRLILEMKLKMIIPISTLLLNCIVIAFYSHILISLMKLRKIKQFMDPLYHCISGSCFSFIK